MNERDEALQLPRGLDGALQSLRPHVAREIRGYFREHARAAQTLIAALQRRIVELRRDAEEALDLLDTFYALYEDGPGCYEEPDECGGYMGNAIKLEKGMEDRVIALLEKHRTRAAAPSPITGEKG